MLTVILRLSCALNFSVLSSVEDEEGEKLPEVIRRNGTKWCLEEANRKGIRIFVDGEEKKMSHPAVMTATGSFLLPVSELTEVFSCTAHIYGQTSLVMEKNMVRAEIIMGEKRMTVMKLPKGQPCRSDRRFRGDGTVRKAGCGSLSDAITKEEENCGFLPRQSRKHFLEMSWEPDENILSFHRFKAGA